MEEIFKVISFKNWSWVKIFQRISLVKIHTHASLARAVFNFKTFFDPRYRPPTPVLMDEVKWKWKWKWSESEVNEFLVL